MQMIQPIVMQKPKQKSFLDEILGIASFLIPGVGPAIGAGKLLGGLFGGGHQEQNQIISSAGKPKEEISTNPYLEELMNMPIGYGQTFNVWDLFGGGYR